MGRPLKTLFKREHSEEISNPSDNRAFSQVAEVYLSRRRLLQAGTVAGAAAAFPFLLKQENALAKVVSKASGNLGKATTLGFTSLPVSTEDTVIVPEGYIAKPFYKWGDATGLPEICRF